MTHEPPFGSALRAHRDQIGMSQSRLGDRAGFDHSYVSRLESGERTPSRDAVWLLAEALGLSMAETDQLLALAGFVPDDPAILLSNWPALATLAGVLGDDRLSAAYRESIERQLAAIAEQARLLL